jgi:hypothetical protein
MSAAARSFKPNPSPSHILALTVPVETAQEPTGERKCLSAAMDTLAVEERYKGSGGSERCGNWGTREPDPQLSERTAAERVGPHALGVP